MQIAKVKASLLEVPLAKPYPLSFKVVTHFPMLLVEVTGADNTGYGECTVLPGYSWENESDVWNFALKHGPSLVGQTAAQAKSALVPLTKKSPFAVTAFSTAIEHMTGFNGHTLHDTKIPIVGIVSGKNKEEVTLSVNELIEKGYKTLKVKAGWNVEEDLERVATVQLAIKPDMKIRIDANQGYNLTQARQFVNSLDPQNIELFEQPFPENDWDSMCSLDENSTVPLMLDESITCEDDVIKALELKCASFLKLKLMKCGSIEQLMRLIKLIEAGGCKAIVGNGVAGDISCYHEALAVSFLNHNRAGEMNGFLKPVQYLLANPLPFKDGHIILTADWRAILDDEKVTRFTTKSDTWCK